MDKRKVIYYTDELHDEFSVAEITPRPIDENYTYVKKGAWHRFACFFWYRIVFTPIAFFYTKIKFRHTTVGREKLKPFLKKGYFMYGNHTQDIGDAFMPNMMNFPQTNHVIVHANNVSMPVLGRLTPMLGALPLPDNMAAYKSFAAAVHTRIAEGRTVVIYPEAHIWPYYTGIRPFTEDSFAYPVKENAPVFCFTNTYKKRGKRPQIVTYIDGPFYSDSELSPRARRTALRDEVYETMCRRAELSDHIQIKYIKKEKTDG